MSELVLALNKLGKVDTAFICICAGIVVAIVAIYFLIPVFKKAQYQQQIDSLRAREAAIKAAREGVAPASDAENEVAVDALTDDTVVSVDSQADIPTENEDIVE
jgi:heme exporter protein D